MSNHYRDLVSRAVLHVRGALDDALYLEELARLAHLSPYHFHRIFRGLVGETPLELHRRLRLERAAAALAVGSESVTRIAFEAGYETHESFTRAFHAAFAAAPSEFRAAARNQATPWSARTAATLAAPSGIHFTSPIDAIPIFSTEREHPMNVTVELISEKRVLAISHRGPYGGVSAAFAQLDSLLRAAHLSKESNLELVALFHDDPEVTPAAELRADAGIVVPADAAAVPGLHEIVLPAGSYAKVIHVGPYETLGDTWSRLMGRWLVTSGHRVGDGPSYERYLNTPMNTAPDALSTELYLPLAESPA